MLSGVGAAALNRFMTGNAVLSLPAPSKNDFDVIELGRSDDTLYLLVRNNTDTPVHTVRVTTVVKGAEGGMLAVDDSLQRFEPTLLKPGEVAYGIVFFPDFTIPEGAVFTHEVTWENAAPGESYGNLVVGEVNLVGNRFVGMLYNDAQETISNSIEAVALCFGEEGSFLFEASEFTVKDEVEAGGSIPFQIEVRDSCPYYLIFATGTSY